MTNDWRDKYDDVWVWGFREGFVKVTLDGKWGFVDKTGKEVIPLKYDWVIDFYDGLAEVELDSKWGFIDKKGNEYWDMTEDQAREQMKNR
jgi:hypothetical protein